MDDPIPGLLQKIAKNVGAGLPWAETALKAAFVFKLRDDEEGVNVASWMVREVDGEKVRFVVEAGLANWRKRTGREA